MWRAKRINGPATIFLMSNQGTNANDRVINMLGKLVAHRGADFVIALDVVPVGCGEALEIRNGSISQTITLLMVVQSTDWLPENPASAHLAPSRAPEPTHHPLS